MRARPPRRRRHRGRRPRHRALGAPAAAARPSPRPAARGALRHRRRPAGEGRGADGEERERLRPAPAAGRVARHDRGDGAGHAALPAARRRRPSGSRPMPIRSRVRRDAVPAVVPRVGRRHHARAARGGRGRRRRRARAGSARRPSAARRRHGPTGPHRGRISVRPSGADDARAGASRRQGAVAGRGRRRHRPRRRRRRARRWPELVPWPNRSAAGCSARPARPVSTASGSRCPTPVLSERIRDRVRSHRQVLARAPPAAPADD